MATIYKRTKRKNEPYTIQHLDHRGRRRTAQGFTDKGLTEQLAAKLETEARLRATGRIDVDQERFVEQRLLPIEDQLLGFEESVADNSPKHVGLTLSRVRRVINGCGFKT